MLLEVPAAVSGCTSRDELESGGELTLADLSNKIVLLEIIYLTNYYITKHF